MSEKDFKFRIEIDGLEKLEQVSELKDILKQLGVEGKEVNKINEERTEQYKQLEKVANDLIRTQAKQKAQETEAYRELLKTTEAVNQNNRTLRQQIRVETAVAGSYNEKSAILNKLRNDLKNLNEEELKGDGAKALRKEITDLDTELKAFDKSMGQHFRNVGDYEGKVTVPLRRQLLVIRREMQQMALAGEMNTEAFKDLEAQSGKLTTAISEAQASIKRTSQASTTLYDLVNVGQSLAGVYGLATSAMSMFGGESEELQKSMQKMMQALTLLNSLQTLNNAITEQGSASNKAFLAIRNLITGAINKNTASTATNTAVTNASTVATLASATALKVLRVALISTGIGALIVLVGTLIANFDEISDVISDLLPEFGGFGDILDEIKNIIMGVGRAILTYVTTPLRVVISIFKGEWKQAFNEFTKGFKIFSNFKEGYDKSDAKNQEERTKKQIEESRKRMSQENDELKYKIDLLEAERGETVKYTKEWIDLYRQYYTDRLKEFDEFTDDWKVANLDLQRFEQSLRKKEADDKAKEEKERNDKAKAWRDKRDALAREEAQRLADYNKAYKEYLRDMELLEKSNTRDYIDTIKAEAKTVEEIQQIYKADFSFRVQLYDDEINEAKKKQKALLADAVKNKQDTTQLEIDFENFIIQLRQKQNQELRKIETEKNKRIVTSIKEHHQRIIDEETKLMQERFANIRDLGKEYQDLSGVWGLPKVSEMREYYAENIGLLKDYLDNLKTSTDKIVSSIDEQMKLYPKDSDEYKSLHDKKKAVLDDYLAKVKQVNDDIEKQNKRSENANDEFLKKLQEVVRKWTDAFQTVFDGFANIFTEVFDSAIERAEQYLENVNEKFDEVVEKYEQSNSRLSELQEQAKNLDGGRLIAHQEKISREMQLNRELQAQENQMRKEKEEAEKRVERQQAKKRKLEATQQMYQSVINTAEGVSKMYALPFPLNFAMAGLVGVLGAVQTGIIARNMSKFEDGGIIGGKRHSEGGNKFYSANGDGVELERGEFVVNRDSTQHNAGLLSFINESRSPISIADISRQFGDNIGALANQQKGQKPNIDISDINKEESLGDSLKDLKVYVSVEEIRETERNMARVEDIAGVNI